MCGNRKIDETMENTSLTGKKALIFSDRDCLARAIELNLNKRLDVQIVKLTLNTLGRWESQVEIDDCDLMVVAMSLPASELSVRTSLAGLVGLVPLLIISDEPFDFGPNGQIGYLDFPFDADGLCNEVKRMLRVGGVV